MQTEEKNDETKRRRSERKCFNSSYLRKCFNSSTHVIDRTNIGFFFLISLLPFIKWRK